MEEIKVGEYVRTIHDGLIEKITGFGNYEYPYQKYYITDNGEHLILDLDFTKHSPNIIDLIEVGDIISLNNMERVFKVIKTDENRIYGAYETLSKSTMLQDYKVAILTKEMYTANCYEVK